MVSDSSEDGQSFSMVYVSSCVPCEGDGASWMYIYKDVGWEVMSERHAVGMGCLFVYKQGPNIV